jgi:arabinosaccharide transport system substrate-binding protein
MKKCYFIVLAVLSLALLFNCSGGKSSDKTVLSFWTFQEAHAEFMNDAVERWNEANPDKQIELEAEVYPYDEMHNKLLISLQSGTGAPDLVDIETSKFANYLKGSTPSLVPLNNVVEPIKDKLIMGRFDMYSKNGKYYGIDYHVGATVIYYNMDILDAAGVDPASIKTWEDFAAAGMKVKQATGKPMTTVEISEHWTFYPLLIQAGGDIFDKNGNIILDNEIAVNVLSSLRDMINMGIAVSAPGGFHHAEEYYAFMNDGGAASIVMPMWFMNRFTNYMPDLKGKILIQPLPLWPQGGHKSCGMGGTGTAVTDQCENAEIAVEFLAFAKLSEDGAIRTYTELGFDPVRWDVWDSPEMQKENEFTEYFQNGTDIFNMLVSISDDIQGTEVPELYPAAIDLLKTKVCFNALGEQSQTPEEALKEAAEQLRSQQ